MKNFILFSILFLLVAGANAQLISRFTWENNPVTASVFGPNAISVSSFATVSNGGANGTRGLNPGAGSNDINLVLDGSYFNVPALDISVDFRREESQASFFYRGAFFNFGMSGGNLVATFQLAGAIVPVTVVSGNIIPIADDHSFHTYRFNYDNNTGIARIWVDTAVVYRFTAPAGTPLYWTGAGNVTIGKDMDATGRNLAILDNMVIQQYASALLPLQLLQFNASPKNKTAVIDWNTTQETNVLNFEVERSVNGAVFSALTTVAPANGYNSINYYQVTDSLPLATLSYYRLKIRNTNGTFTYSAVKAIRLEAAVSAEITLFPNPTVDYVYLKLEVAASAQYHYTVTSIGGQNIIAADRQLGSGTQQIKIDLTKTTAKGILVITLVNLKSNNTKTFTIIKK